MKKFIITLCTAALFFVGQAVAEKITIIIDTDLVDPEIVQLLKGGTCIDKRRAWRMYADTLTCNLALPNPGPYCGDGVVQTGEVCDSGNKNGHDDAACDLKCQSKKSTDKVMTKTGSIPETSIIYRLPATGAGVNTYYRIPSWIMKKIKEGSTSK